MIKYPNISGGVEPQFDVCFYRNRKINPNEKDVRVDFTDQNGDSWMTYPVFMGGFKEYIDINHPKAALLGHSNLTKEMVDEIYKQSPYYKACANDISWKKRIEMQSIVQRYTSNAISSTLNLPENVSKDTVRDIYMTAWELGLKGTTIYRDNCRTGVLVRKPSGSSFEYRDALKRPKEIDSELNVVTVKGKKYGVVVGLIDNKPYEVFAFDLPSDIRDSVKGKTVKIKKNQYDFISQDGVTKNLQSAALHREELLLTRMVSGMLRHGAKPQFVVEQIDKSDLEVVSFGKAISRTLKKYCNEEEMAERATCSNCGSTDIRMSEGCSVCNTCGHSKC